MENVLMNKFEIIDMPGMNTLAFVVEENESEVISGETYYSLQKLEHTDKEMDGKITKEFFVVNDSDGMQDVVLLTLTKSKAILSTAMLDKNGLTPTEDKLPLSYGSLYDDSNIQYKEFTYTQNLKRRFAIIDTTSCEEVKPVLYRDEVTGEIKGKCKLLPLRPYVVLEIKDNFNRGAVVATDGRRIEAMSHGKVKMPEHNIEIADVEVDVLGDDDLIV
ncbi:MAG: hypothetical protein IJ272_05915 [Clostridia bacterium]|nr:hypothetical protein [Clostridia bacterium]